MQASALLGVRESALPTDVRIGRRGGEAFMLTEDYVVGRLTVQLHPDPAGKMVVTSVTIELPDGPQTLTA